MRRLLGAGLLAALLAGGEARGADHCDFTSIVGVSFGEYDPLALSPVDSAGRISFSCHGNAKQPIPIYIDLSKGWSSSYSIRRMQAGGSKFLAYNLYLDAARTIIWGDGTDGSSRLGPLSVPPLGLEQRAVVYGRAPALQNVTAGSYSDVIVVTINF